MINTAAVKLEPPTIPSDALASIYELLDLYPELARHLGGPQRVRLVIDANVVLADLRWLVGRRKNPNARTSLLEVISAGTVVPYAPTVLRAEVTKEIPSIAAEIGVPETDLFAAWGAYEAHLHFARPHDELSADAAASRDPKDLPYIHLCAEVNAAAVYTRDKDIAGMGGRVVSAEILLSLRDYARAASVEMTLKIGGSVVTIAGVEGLCGIIALVKYGVIWMRRLPRGAQAALVIGGACLLIHPRSREIILSALRRASKAAADAFVAIAPILADLAQLVLDAQRMREHAWSVAAPEIQNGTGAPLKTYVRAVCVAEREPMTVGEIARRVRLAGYTSRARDFERYVRRLLRADPRYAEGVDGCWTLETGI